MARVSISEAARLAGISRGSLYKTYLNKGVISVSKDEGGKKFIETSELLRVFNTLQGDKSNQEGDTQSKTGKQEKDSSEVLPVTGTETAKDIEIRLLREQLDKSEQREQWLQQKIDTLSDTVKLLESPKYPREWWQFWK